MINLLLLTICLSVATVVDEVSALNIAIIGGGPTGLCSSKHSIAQGHNVTIYEQNEDVGGTWLYTDEIGRNKYGLKIHSAMYRELRLPLSFLINLSRKKISILHHITERMVLHKRWNIPIYAIRMTLYLIHHIQMY